jgi:hypothetical protein
LIYTKTTFHNDNAPAIDEAWLNLAGSTILALAQNSMNRATITAGSSSSNYKISIPGYSSAPSGSEIPFMVLMTPNATNISPCTVTPSWGSASYPIRDPIRNANIQAGEITNGIPCYLIFDGTYFWHMSSKGMVAGTDYVVPMSVATSLPLSGTALQNNTEYIISSPLSNYEFAWPSNPFHVYVMFSTGATPNITFPEGTLYTGGATSFLANATYEMDVKNGMVVCAEVMTS